MPLLKLRKSQPATGGSLVIYHSKKYRTRDIPDILTKSAEKTLIVCITGITPRKPVSSLSAPEVQEFLICGVDNQERYLFQDLSKRYVSISTEYHEKMCISRADGIWSEPVGIKTVRDIFCSTKMKLAVTFDYNNRITFTSSQLGVRKPQHFGKLSSITTYNVRHLIAYLIKNSSHLNGMEIDICPMFLPVYMDLNIQLAKNVNKEAKCITSLQNIMRKLTPASLESMSPDKNQDIYLFSRKIDKKQLELTKPVYLNLSDCHEDVPDLQSSVNFRGDEDESVSVKPTTAECLAVRGDMWSYEVPLQVPQPSKPPYNISDMTCQSSPSPSDSSSPRRHAPGETDGQLQYLSPISPSSPRSAHPIPSECDSGFSNTWPTSELLPDTTPIISRATSKDANHNDLSCSLHDNPNHLDINAANCWPSFSQGQYVQYDNWEKRRGLHDLTKQDNNISPRRKVGVSRSVDGIVTELTNESSQNDYPLQDFDTLSNTRENVLPAFLRTMWDIKTNDSVHYTAPTLLFRNDKSPVPTEHTRLHESETENETKEDDVFYLNMSAGEVLEGEASAIAKRQHGLGGHAICGSLSTLSTSSVHEFKSHSLPVQAAGPEEKVFVERVRVYLIDYNLSEDDTRSKSLQSISGLRWYTSHQLKSLTLNDVVDILKILSLKKHIKTFIEKRIDGQTLCSLSAADLYRLGFDVPSAANLLTYIHQCHQRKVTDTGSDNKGVYKSTVDNIHDRITVRQNHRDRRLESFTSIYDVPKELSGLSTQQIAQCLKLLSLEKYTPLFQFRRIDGMLLTTLTESMLLELGLSRLDVHVISMFRDGWRPS